MAAKEIVLKKITENGYIEDKCLRLSRAYKLMAHDNEIYISFDNEVSVKLRIIERRPIFVGKKIKHSWVDMPAAVACFSILVARVDAHDDCESFNKYSHLQVQFPLILGDPTNEMKKKKQYVFFSRIYGFDLVCRRSLHAAKEVKVVVK